MDTPIRLIASKSQRAFLGTISDTQLERLINTDNDLVLATVKWVLGKDFLASEDRYRVNSNIASRFVGSLLDLGAPKDIIARMTMGLFEKEITGDIINTNHSTRVATYNHSKNLVQLRMAKLGRLFGTCLDSYLLSSFTVSNKQGIITGDYPCDHGNIMENRA
ncbi:hypothetical protein SUGI_0737230 [Cryptomeria japonica]|nr:hypothetical protein SUGI_0737230 [Cryptomeria japonica]